MDARDFCSEVADDECKFILWVSLLAAGKYVWEVLRVTSGIGNVLWRACALS